MITELAIHTSQFRKLIKISMLRESQEIASVILTIEEAKQVANSLINCIEKIAAPMRRPNHHFHEEK